MFKNLLKIFQEEVKPEEVDGQATFASLLVRAARIDNEYLNSEIDKPVFCNLETCDYISHPDKDDFNLDHFINYPKEYSSSALPYLKLTDVYVSAHYWDPASPKIFEKNQLNELKKLKVIGDITCDVNGSVPTTTKSTSI